MPGYENMMVTITIFLFFVNAVFLFTAFLPGTENGDGTLLNVGITPGDINDMNNKINGVIDSSGVFTPSNNDTNNANVNVTGQEKGYLTLFQNWLFGSLDTLTLGLSSAAINSASILGTVLSLFGATFFGYLFWIDLFINPLWGPGFAIMGAGLKVFFFVVQAMWLFSIIMSVFFAGTGTRSL